jgi:hypothetical protein
VEAAVKRLRAAIEAGEAQRQRATGRKAAKRKVTRPAKKRRTPKGKSKI